MSTLTKLQAEEEMNYKKKGKRGDRIFSHFFKILQVQKITEGVILELGGRENPIKDKLAGSKFSYKAIDLKAHAEYVTIADITHCPNIPSNSIDAFYSVDVFEHINRPWQAAAEITRILKPGGIAYTSTVFSWRYHPCPIDYWRFTPACLEFLFDGLDTICSDFDDTERRRNILGKGQDLLKSDSFGGWRENWRVFHCGKKK